MIKIEKSEYPNIVKLYTESGLSSNEISNLYNVSGETIVKILRKSDVVLRKTNQGYYNRHLNTNFFEEETEASAYYFGLLLSDGNISDRGKVSINLQDIDKHILDSLKQVIGTDNKVSTSLRKDGTRSVQLVFTNGSIKQSLNSLGMFPRKSLKEVCPPRFTFNRHFWRGMIDGDGCITLPINSSPRVYLCGSEIICNQFLEYCKKIRPDIQTTTKCMGNVFRVTVTGNKAKDIVKELYRDSEFFLIRKKKLASDLLFKYSENFDENHC